MASADQSPSAHEDFIDEVIIDVPKVVEENEIRQAVPAWIVSILAHVVVLSAMGLIVYSSRTEVEIPPFATVQLPPAVDDLEPPKRRDLEPPKVDLKIDSTIETEHPSPLVTEFEVSVEEFNRESEIESDVPQGREEAIADSEMGGTGMLMTLGAGPGAAGAIGHRDKGGKTRALRIGGGTRTSENAVDAALRWFKRHQSPNGQWDVDGYTANCTEHPKCEPGQAHTGSDGDLAGTGYAVLCYLGAGYDHRMTSKYKPTVKKGLDWLVSQQKPDGAFGERNYEHAIVTMALAEAYAMTRDPALRQPAQKAVDIILQRQAKDGAGGYGLGWDYVAGNPARNDASVTGWCAMALKSAKASDLSVGNGMEGTRHYLERAWQAANPTFKASNPYTDVSVFPYCWNAESGKADGHTNMAPVAALLAVFLGHKADDPMLNSLANFIMKNQLPTKYPCNTYYLYYNTMAIFQVAGERWPKWNKAMLDVLVPAQRTDACFDGSWDWVGTEFHGNETGRLLSTAYCCLSLEVYYRYEQIGGAH